MQNRTRRPPSGFHKNTNDKNKKNLAVNYPLFYDITNLKYYNYFA